jgi:hypothetical protein
MKPENNDSLFDSFGEYVSTNISVIDLMGTNEKFMKDGFDQLRNDPFMLPIDDLDMKEHLLKNGYVELLDKLKDRLQLLPECMDIYRSFFENESIEMFQLAVKHHLGYVKIVPDEIGVLVNCPASISDIILTPISRVHHEIQLSTRQFIDFYNAVGKDSKRLFLNAKGSNKVSQFIQLWVSGSLGIRNSISNSTVVVT